MEEESGFQQNINELPAICIKESTLVGDMEIKKKKIEVRGISLEECMLTLEELRNKKFIEKN